jgi:RNA polymerase-interacting CarD/CdnL/TRCF family regulator
MLHSAKQIMISEIGMAQSISYQEAENRVNKAFHS